MADSKDFVAGIDSNAKKSPRRVVFITRRTSAQVKAETEDQIQTFPEVLFRAAVAIMTLATVLVWIALAFNAPLEGLADPSHTPNPAKAPWYFLGQWRSGIAEVGTHAGMRKHAEQIRRANSDLLYSRCVRSTLSTRRPTLYREHCVP